MEIQLKLCGNSEEFILQSKLPIDLLLILCIKRNIKKVPIA